jgi:hexosaminidase
MVLFPGSFVHIGGDEVRGGPWLGCPRCRQRMQEKGFTTAKQYQNWFTHRIDSFISAHGKRMIGWDEVLGADITPTAAAMLWHNQDAALQALKKGHDMVMAPYRYTYFDFYQSDPRLEPNITYAALPLDTVYSFEPTPPGLTAEENKHVLGGEACLWTENFATPAEVEYMLLPRLLALAEVLWSPAGKKDYPRFVSKTEAQFVRLHAENLHYATSLYNVAILPAHATDRYGIRVALTDQTHLYPIRYTLDGSEPTPESPRYNSPLLITHTAVLHASVFKNDRPVGKTNCDTFTFHQAIGTDITETRLTDGIHGTIEPYDGRWVIFPDSVVTVVLDLERTRHIHGVSIGCLEDQVGDMYLPQSAIVACSNDGAHYEPIFTQTNTKLPEQPIRHIVHYHKEGLTIDARYVKFTFIRDKKQFVIDELEVQ